MKAPLLMLVIAEDWYFWSHRLAVARGALARGYRVALASRFRRHRRRIEEQGIETVPLVLRREGRNPLAELAAARQLTALYRARRPAVAHHVGIKPIFHGTLAASRCSVPAVNAFAGLGHLYTARSWKLRAARALFRSALRRALRRVPSRTIVQTPEDGDAVARAGLAPAGTTVLIRGCGVDLERFAPQPEPEAGEKVVMYAGRMLWNKGVGRLVDAVAALRGGGIRCRLVLVGEPDPANPRAIPEGTLRRWAADPAVDWWGRREDMPAVLAQSHLLALPTSYGEGVPKILIEAGALGRPAVVSDAPGCREVVRHEINGLRVPPGDDDALAAALARLISDAGLRRRMGRAARRVVAEQFDQADVVRRTVDVYDRLTGRAAGAGEKP